jgi:hypothetical protein
MKAYNLDAPDQNYFQDVNLNALPNSIRVELDKIYEEYEKTYILLPGDDDINFFAKHRRTFNKLNELLKADKLFTSHFTSQMLEDSNLKIGFEEVNNKYYKFKNDAYFDWYIAEFYRAGFLEGYNSDFDIGGKTQKIFSTVYKRSDESIDKCNKIFDEYFDFDVLHPHYFYFFGKEEGKFIKAWDYVLKFPKKFESKFAKDIPKSNYIKDEKSNSEINLLKEKKQSKSLLFNGKPLNLKERYKIATEVLNTDKTIRTLNVTDTEKYKLLSYILGCNETNARHLMNGSYCAHVRNEVIQNYIHTLNK